MYIPYYGRKDNHNPNFADLENALRMIFIHDVLEASSIRRGLRSGELQGCVWRAENAKWFLLTLFILNH